jgi:hypothetical protein
VMHWTLLSGSQRMHDNARIADATLDLDQGGAVS